MKKGECVCVRGWVVVWVCGCVGVYVCVCREVGLRGGVGLARKKGDSVEYEHSVSKKNKIGQN